MLVLFAAGSGLIAVPAAAAEVDAGGDRPSGVAASTDIRGAAAKSKSAKANSTRTPSGPRSAKASPTAGGKRSDRPRTQPSSASADTRTRAAGTRSTEPSAADGTEAPGPRAGRIAAETASSSPVGSPAPRADPPTGAAAATDGPVQIQATGQTITFTPTPDTPLSDGTVTVSATATSGLTVTFSSLTGAVCTVSGTTVTLATLGTCTVAADQAGDGSYDPAPQVTDSFEITKDSQTITWTPTMDTALTAGSVGLSATATSGLPVTFSSATPGVCTVSGSTATFVAGGTCTVDADQAGDATYDAAPQSSDSFEVTKTPQTITFTAPADQAFTTTPVPLTASATSTLPVAFTSATPAVCTVADGAVTLVTVGTCTINADQAGNGTYDAAPQVNDSFAISQGSQTITMATPADLALSDGAVTLAPTATSGLTVTLASTDPAVCTVSGVAVTPVAVGTCTITADQAGNGNWLAAPQIEVAFDITQGAQTISVTPPGNQALSASPVNLTATATSGLPVAFTSATPAVCTVSGSDVTLVTTGTCTVNANQAGDTNWAAAPQATATFTVAADTQTITFPTPADTPLSDSPVTVSATASSGLAVTFSTATSAVCTVSGTSVTLLAAGTCTINANQAGNADYAAADQASASFTVQVGEQTITYPAPADRSYTDGPFTPVATASSGLPVALASTTPTVCTVSGATVTPVAAGTCTVTADQAGDSNWAAADQVSRSITVTPGAQSITFTPPSPTAVSSGPVTVTATATSQLPVSFASTTPTVCTVAGTTVALVAVGACTISASQAGDTRYAAAPAVEGTFAVLQDPEPVTIPADQPPASDGTLDNSTGSTAEPGDAFTLTGSGFKPNTQITVVVYSTPQTIGTTTTDGTGTFSLAVTLPEDLPSGGHTLVAAGLAPDNTVRYLTQALTVASGTDPTDDASSNLPITGGPVTATVLLGAMLIVVGGLLTQLGRSRVAGRGGRRRLLA